MESQQANPYLFENRPILKSKSPAVKWFKEWVPQEISGTGGKCSLLRWVTEDMLKALREKHKEPEPCEQEPEPDTEVLYLCSYEGCGKTFIDPGALKKHSHIHGERQYVCHYEGCGRKFMDSSKLKRHFLIHTGERSFVCTYEGCGKAFSLDFNLRAHMRTHSQENYHVCPYEDCGKRYAHEYKLKAHIKAHHEKHKMADVVKRTPPSERLHATPKTPVVYATPTPERPYACPYAGCGKAYIHEYKLNLHLRREHPGHTPGENGNPTTTPEVDNDMDEASDQEGYTRVVKGSAGGKNLKRSKTKTPSKLMPPLKMAKKKGSSFTPSVDMNVAARKPWPGKETLEEDSEETEEDRDNMEEDTWQYGDNNYDDEDTEYED